ncbi:DNA-binding transcriptional LysR family regulator [Rhizomicrobium palustre]|uniref:DNA-binding transcriptional LysR family regulator n=1 Tax=Rhizomicrobium palustre TaxID=189966 RepID=A0A846MVL1_9PROT|nr:LysR family transcriptional regulator [Rhizomicrobium palustre]NIK87100.1 DNA-binding transcriptional LysR family regulator [Rhizomicrobium palustre]
MRNSELTDLAAFVLVAEHLSFRAAADKLAVTPSALSHRLRQLEQTLGVRLLNRTTRSVSPTDAGRKLLEQLAPALEQISGAVDSLQHVRSQPAGKLTIHSVPMITEIVIAPIWRKYLQLYPDVQLEIGGTQEMIDIVAHGYDAGIGPREFVALDMTAVRVTPTLQTVVVGSPSYFARHPMPKTPQDLLQHNCIQNRLRASQALLPWTFISKRTSQRSGQTPTRSLIGKAGVVPVTGNIIVDDIDIALRAAVDGVGLAYTLETSAELFIRSGHVVPVLEGWSPAFEGMYLYYPGKRQVPPALRALIDMVKTTQTSAGHAGEELPFIELLPGRAHGRSEGARRKTKLAQ